jgi:hypothetical protein
MGLLPKIKIRFVPLIWAACQLHTTKLFNGTHVITILITLLWNVANTRW